MYSVGGIKEEAGRGEGRKSRADRSGEGEGLTSASMARYIPRTGRKHLICATYYGAADAVFTAARVQREAPKESPLEFGVKIFSGMPTAD